MASPYAIIRMTRNFLVVPALIFTLATCACRRGTGKNTSANGAVTTANESESERSNREARSLVEKGKELYKNDQDEPAAQAFQQAIRLQPDLAEAHLRLGMANAALGKKDEAEESYKKAMRLYKKQIESNSKDHEVFFNLGQAHSLLHQDEEAAHAFRQATRIKSDDEEAFYQLGMSETRLAHYPEAITAFQRALDLNPDDYRATDAIETAREGVNRIKEGKKHAEDLLKKQQNENANGNINSNTNSEGRPVPKRSPRKPW